MKTKFVQPALVCGLLATMTFFTITGCKKSSSGSSGGSVTGTLSGSGYQSTQAFGVVTASSNVFFVGGIRIKSGDTTDLSVTFPDTVALNTAIPFDGSTVFIDYLDEKTLTEYTNEGSYTLSGSITISSWNKSSLVITGAFTGTIYNPLNSNDSLVVTNGAFSNVKYTIQ